MAFNDTALVVAANALAADITHISLHTTGAVTSSTDESTAARRPVTLTVDGDGDVTFPAASFTGGAASGPVVRVGYWTALTGGTYRGGSLIASGDTTFNAAGEYNTAAFTETSSAS